MADEFPVRSTVTTQDTVISEERERERTPAVGEQGGFKHGQKRLF
jgi:hypothetical protein